MWVTLRAGCCIACQQVLGKTMHTVIYRSVTCRNLFEFIPPLFEQLSCNLKLEQHTQRHKFKLSNRRILDGFKARKRKRNGV